MTSYEAGRKDAKDFITNQRIDYTPFVAMSEMHMVRNAIAVDYGSLKKTLEKADNDLWAEIESAAVKREKEHGNDFSFDEYTKGFVEGVAAVWEQIKDNV